MFSWSFEAGRAGAARRHGLALLLGASVLAYAGGAMADETAVAQNAGPRPDTQVLTKADAGSAYTLKLQYTGEGWYNATGGLAQGAVYMQNADGQLYVDAEKAFGLKGGSFLVDVFYNTSRSLEKQYIDAIQDPSAIDTDGVSLLRVYQAYYKQDLGNTNVLFGLYDAETEFGVTKPMDIFFNGAFAWTSTLDISGVSGPSTYPNTALALRVRHRFDEHWSVQAAALNGASDSPNFPRKNAVIFNGRYGAMLLGEVDYHASRYTKLMAGAWDFTGRFDALGQTNDDGSQRQKYGSYGGYIGGATRLFSQENRRGLDGFINLGIADGTTHEVDRALNLGLNYAGPFAARPDDHLGFGVGFALASNDFRRAQLAEGVGVRRAETAFELTYRAQVNDWLTVQPDVQYFVHPGLDPLVKNDLVIGIHFELGRLFHF
jgi:porin